jgi:hypothetical protein
VPAEGCRDGEWVIEARGASENQTAQQMELRLWEVLGAIKTQSACRHDKQTWEEHPLQGALPSVASAFRSPEDHNRLWLRTHAGLALQQAGNINHQAKSLPPVAISLHSLALQTPRLLNKRAVTKSQQGWETYGDAGAGRTLLTSMWQFMA